MDGFLNLLVQSGIRRLVDVRNNPISRRYGFHKATLGRLCGFLDIDYQHVPELGIQPVLRQTWRSAADYEVLFGRYVAESLPRQNRGHQSGWRRWCGTSPAPWSAWRPILTCATAVGLP